MKFKIIQTFYNNCIPYKVCSYFRLIHLLIVLKKKNKYLFCYGYTLEILN